MQRRFASFFANLPPYLHLLFSVFDFLMLQLWKMFENVFLRNKGFMAFAHQTCRSLNADVISTVSFYTGKNHPGENSEREFWSGEVQNALVVGQCSDQGALWPYQQPQPSCKHRGYKPVVNKTQYQSSVIFYEHLPQVNLETKDNSFNNALRKCSCITVRADIPRVISTSVLHAWVSHCGPGSASTGPQQSVQPGGCRLHQRVPALPPLSAGAGALVFCSLKMSPWVLHLLEKAASRYKLVNSRFCPVYIQPSVFWMHTSTASPALTQAFLASWVCMKWSHITVKW